MPQAAHPHPVPEQVDRTWLGTGLGMGPHVKQTVAVTTHLMPVAVTFLQTVTFEMTKESSKILVKNLAKVSLGTTGTEGQI